MGTKQETFIRLTKFLDSYLNHSTDTKCIDVFPLRCGIGKTTYTTHKISEVLTKGKDGLIVVTDSVERLKEYTTSGDDKLIDYVNRNINKIAILNKDNISVQLKTQYKKPVLLMTTQRYFNLTREEIIHFTNFSGGKRSRIIFDEYPYLSEQRRICINTFNRVDDALHESLDDTVNISDKQWLIDQWERFKIRMQNIIAEYENQNTESQMTIWHYNEGEQLTEDDTKFFSLIKKYRLNLNRYSIDTYKNIQAIRQMIYEGATFTSRKRISKKFTNNKYDNFFTVVIDNSDKLIDIEAKVFVLDGTADITPSYKLPYVNMIDCTEFCVPLNNLTINIVNIPTGKTRLCGGSDNSTKIINCIIAYIKALPQNNNVLFTYQKIASRFKEHFEKVNYFGNIKGKNDYRDKENIVQVGLNRFPDLEYQLTTYFTKLYPSDADSKRCLRYLGESSVNKTMNELILSDIEQNLFRSKIRNVDCDEPVTYTMFFNTHKHKGLIELMKERYGSLGASVNVVSAPLEYQLIKTKERNTIEQTHSQKILDWLFYQPKGKVFKSTEMLDEIGLTKKQFDKAKSNNPSLTEIFKQMAVNKRGYYQRNE